MPALENWNLKFQSETFLIDGWSCYDDGDKDFDVKGDAGFYIVDIESTFCTFIILLMTTRSLEQLEVLAVKLYVWALSEGAFLSYSGKNPSLPWY